VLHTHKTGVHMASILPFIRESDFDDEATRLMGEAFDAACSGLHDTGQPIVVHGGHSQADCQGGNEGRARSGSATKSGLAAFLGYDREVI
jgi:hypothetical protein